MKLPVKPQIPLCTVSSGQIVLTKNECEYILREEETKLVMDNCGVTSDDEQPNTENRVEMLSAIVVQRFFRNFLFLAKLKRSRQVRKALIIQAAIRGFLSRSRYVDVRNNRSYKEEIKPAFTAESIQALARRKEAAVLIQACVRGFLGRLEVAIIILKQRIDTIEEERKASLLDVEKEKQQELRKIFCTEQLFERTMRQISLLMQMNKRIKRDIKFYKKQSKKAKKCILKITALNEHMDFELEKLEAQILDNEENQDRLLWMEEKGKEKIGYIQEVVDKVEASCREDRRIRQTFQKAVFSICDFVRNKSDCNELTQQVEQANNNNMVENALKVVASCA